MIVSQVDRLHVKTPSYTTFNNNRSLVTTHKRSMILKNWSCPVPSQVVLIHLTDYNNSNLALI